MGIVLLNLGGSIVQAKDGDRPTVSKTSKEGTAAKAGAGAKSGSAAKSGTERAFLAAKRDFQRRIHNKKATERIAALKLLADFPTADAADLVYVSLLDDREGEVRDAAVDFLTALRDRNDVTEKLLSRMTNTTRKDGMDLRAIGALRALGGTEDDALQFRLINYLNEFLGTPQADQQLLHGMIDEQAPRGEADLMRLLMLFTRTEFFNRHFGLRRCVVQGMAQVKERDAITHLINLLPRFKGLVQFDVVSHLMVATGQNFGDDAAKWKVWWTEHQNPNSKLDKSKIPPVGPFVKFGEYYGIPICAKRVVFVLDTSGSMRIGKLEAAQAELIRVIRELPKEVFFSIVAFDSNVRVWQRELVPATEQMKHIAVNVVLEQQARNDTASYDALEAAFDLDPEAIYFLSDGNPQGGKITDPAQIVGTLSSVNRVRRVSIHSIGIDTNNPGAAGLAKFMQTLAEANWGVYKAVN
jgi:uncharacterized protein YegL